MDHIEVAMLIDAINAQPDEFDSHDIIRFLYTKYQHEYLNELNSRAGAKLPFTETHQQIGRALSRLDHLIIGTGKVPSGKTFRGEKTPVESWRKVAACLPSGPGAVP